MVDLLSYDPLAAVGEHTFRFPGMERFSHFFTLYGPRVMPVDRTGTLSFPISVMSLFPIPTYTPCTEDFESLCNERAAELLALAGQLDKPLAVLWSGGIDSTLVLVSLFKNATPQQKENITVLLNESSIIENPAFFAEHIKGKVTVKSSETFASYIDGEALLLDGELNDQLFGSDIIGKLIANHSVEVAHSPYSRDLLFAFFNKTLDASVITDLYLDLFERLAHSAPVPIVTNFHFLWWINFTLKWQHVATRKLHFILPTNIEKITWEYVQTKHLHFYGTDRFQLWSMSNLDKRMKDTWATYKWVCKDIIYEYTKDSQYRDTKLKKASQVGLFLQRHSYPFIGSGLRFYEELAPETYYNPKNDLV